VPPSLPYPASYHGPVNDDNVPRLHRCVPNHNHQAAYDHHHRPAYHRPAHHHTPHCPDDPAGHSGHHRRRYHRRVHDHDDVGTNNHNYEAEAQADDDDDKA
jgi:hypothetical protein